MTKIEALEKSLEMWEWIAQQSNPEFGCGDKENYLAKVCELEREDYPTNECFLCEYCYKNNAVQCEKCPVQWTSATQEKAEGIYCQRRSSPYEDWRMADSKEWKQKYAHKVADLIRTTLEKERNKK